MKRQKATKRGDWASVIKDAKVLRAVKSRGCSGFSLYQGHTAEFA
jgi:hypothetical protein